MAIFRKIHTTFWSDPFIQDLTIEQRYFYLYLLTNEYTKQCGIYEISKKQISFDTGYSIDRVSILLNFFIKTGKIKYNDSTKELALKNWLKYNASTSPKVKSCIGKEFALVKDRVLIEYLYSMDTHPQEEEEKEQEEEKEIKFNFKKSLLEKVNDKKLVEEWLDVRKKKKLTNSETALKGFLKQVELSGYSVTEVLTKCVEKSWGGFEAAWYTKEPKQKSEPSQQVTFDLSGYKNFG